MSFFCVGICGFGYMGRLYLHNLLMCGIKTRIVILDIDERALSVAVGIREELELQNFFFTNEVEIFFAKIFPGNFLIITSPVNTHFFYVQKALDLHLNVLCEKPFGDIFSKRIFYLNEFQNRRLILKVSFPERYFSKRVVVFNRSDFPIYIDSQRTSFYRGQDLQIFNVVQDLMIHDLDHVLELLQGEYIESVESSVDNFLEEKNILCIQIKFLLSCGRNVQWKSLISYQDRKKRNFFWRDLQNVDSRISFVTSENLLQKQLVDFLQHKNEEDSSSVEFQKNILLFETLEKIQLTVITV